MLIAPVVAFVVEGVITPIIYTGGPFVPFFPAWFTFWHGMFSFIGLVFVVRRWLLDEALGRLSIGSVAIGCFWALWSSTLRLPENVNDPEIEADLGAALHVLDPIEFARYATVMTALFLASHFFIGFVWPRPGRSSGRSGRLGWRERAILGLSLAGAIMWTVVVPWALPMFALYCGLQLRGLRWHRASVAPGTPSLIDELSGRVRLRALAPLAVLAPAAAGAYALLWELDPSDQALRVVMYGTIAVQALTGLLVAVRALLRSRRAATSSSTASSASHRVASPSR